MSEECKNRSTILIIGDDRQIRNLLAELLSTDYDCPAAGSAEDALAILNTRNFDLVISEINMGGIRLCEQSFA
jgi:DNA-binding NtrC family response regulator